MVLIVGVVATLTSFAVHADDTTGPTPDASGLADPDSSWQGRGVYDLKEAGIRIHVGAQQHILVLHNNPFAPLRRCHLEIQALVHDEKLGLMLIGRWQSGRPVINDWDAVSAEVFAGMPDWYRRRPEGQGWARFPVREADFYEKPTYDPGIHVARWVFSFVHGDVSWFSSHWMRFDRDGYIVVSLLSQGAAIDALDSVLSRSTPPIEVENLMNHPAPLPPPGDPENYTAGFLATMSEPVVGACEFRTPFGNNF